MLTVLGIALLLKHSLCVNPSILFQEVQAYHSETSAKTDFAYQVVDKIYNAFRQWFFTIIFCEFTYFESRILKYTENYNDGYPVLLLDGCPTSNNSETKPRIDKHGKTAYIVTSNQLTVENNDLVIYTLRRTGVFKPRSVVIFVINIEVTMDSYFHYAMKEHFQLCWGRRIPNSILVLWSERLRMYTYNPFFDQIIDVSNEKNIGRLLTRQYENLYGRELRLSVFRKPFIYDDTAQIDCSSRLASTMMSILNASCKALAPRDGSTVGDLLDNGTATGVTSDLMDGYTDLELNSRILKNSYYGYIDTTYPLSQDSLCFLLKKAGPQSTFMTTMKLISTDMFLIFMFNIFLMLLIALVVLKVELRWWAPKDTQSSATTVIELVKCFIRQTVVIKFLGPVFRAVVLLIIIYSLIIDCAIDGILTSAITYPRYKPEIDSAAALLASNLTLGIHIRHLRLFNNSLTPEYRRELEAQNRIEAFNDKKIKAFIDKRQFQYAVLLRQSDAKYISRKTSNLKYGRPLFHTMLECPLPCSIVYGLRYGSPYLPVIDKKLHYLFQGGILQQWVKTEEFTVNSKIGNALSGNNKERKALTLHNLQEVFLVLIGGYVISGIFFIVELCLHKATRVQIHSLQ
ncbi:uncharacterized protein LOC134794487 [Cydia splendana]|uniref:uncharacterized protein LOC134794487 n=1 Tax=Cydia splendana TaxID=1100963 RepID=UPI00213101AF